MESIVAFVALAVLGGVMWLCILGVFVDPEILKGMIVIGGVALTMIVFAYVLIAAWRGKDR